MWKSRIVKLSRTHPPTTTFIDIDAWKKHLENYTAEKILRRNDTINKMLKQKG